MFSKALAIFALAAAALAVPTRPGGLTVSVKAPEHVTSVDGLKIIASVTNSGSEDVTIVKYGTVLDKLPTQSFKVSKGGVEAKFTGIKMSLSSQLTEDAYTVIPAGKTVTVEHDISALYDFESLGEGAFDITPLSDVPVVTKLGATPELAPFVFESTPTAAVHVTGDIAKRFVFGEPEPAVEKRDENGNVVKRATVSCSNSSQRSFISSSYSEGKSLASLASSYIASNGANSLYTSYYKTASTSTVRGVFNNVANENSSSRTLNCSDPYGVCNGNVIAYTYMTGSNNVYFCSIFYNEVASSRLCSGTTVASRNVRGGTTLHELTHATSGTTDVGYGCSYDQGLSASNAVRNADNYNCMATQVYANTQC